MTPFARVATLALLLLCAACHRPLGRYQLDEPLFYPEPPDPPRMQFLTAFETNEHVEQGPSKFDRFVAGVDPQSAAIQGPWGVAYRDGEILVCDLQQSTILRLDLIARRFTYIKDKGRGKLRKPVQCVFGDDGLLYVADRGRRQIVCFDRELNYLREYGPVNDEFVPVDVAVRPDAIYVCDRGNRSIQVIDRESGEALRTLGGPEELTAPTSIAFTSAGECLVVDSARNRVCAYGPDGTLTRTIGQRGQHIGCFARAKSVDVDPSGYIYVTDSAFENCQVFTPDGDPIFFFGGSGVGPGNLYLPTDVFIADSGFGPFAPFIDPHFDVQYLIFIVSQYGPNKVSVYAFGRSSEFEYDE